MRLYSSSSLPLIFFKVNNMKTFNITLKAEKGKYSIEMQKAILCETFALADIKAIATSLDEDTACIENLLQEIWLQLKGRL